MPSAPNDISLTMAPTSQCHLPHRHNDTSLIVTMAPVSQ